VKVVFLLDRIASRGVNDLNRSRNISGPDVKKELDLISKVK